MKIKISHSHKPIKIMGSEDFGNGSKEKIYIIIGGGYKYEKR